MREAFKVLKKNVSDAKTNKIEKKYQKFDVALERMYKEKASLEQFSEFERKHCKESVTQMFEDTQEYVELLVNGLKSNVLDL